MHILYHLSAGNMFLLSNMSLSLMKLGKMVLWWFACLEIHEGAWIHEFWGNEDFDSFSLPMSAKKYVVHFVYSTPKILTIDESGEQSAVVNPSNSGKPWEKNGSWIRLVGGMEQ